MKLKINNIPGFDGTITVKTDENGVIYDKFWRKRLKDAQYDNCVEVVNEDEPKAKPKKRGKKVNDNN